MDKKEKSHNTKKKKLVDVCGERLRKMNGLIDRSLNTANKDRWGEMWCVKTKMPLLIAECFLRLYTISVLGRWEDTTHVQHL